MHRLFTMRLPLLLAAAALLAPSLRGADVDGAAIDGIVKASLKTWEVPGAALLIVRDDKVAYLKGYGVRDLESGKPVTPDTLFAIASCSKAFTATSIGILADEKKMSWDDPVRKHIPFFRLNDPLADNEVKIRDLLCHRTGVKRHDYLGHLAPWDRAEILRRVAFVKPSFGFRARFQYNNLMYMAAGYAAGQANHSTWEDVVRKRILDPLGMKQTNFSARDAEKAADHAVPHVPGKDGKHKTIHWDNIDNMGPAGSMNSSARDLAPWLRFQLGDGTFEGKRILSAANLEEAHSPQMIIPLDSIERRLNPESLQKSYGLAWFIQDYRGRLLLSHTGGLDGFRCRILLVPSARLGIAILSNSSTGVSRASLPVACTYTLADHILGLPTKDWDRLYHDFAVKADEQDRADQAKKQASRRKDTKPTRELAAYAGDYNEPAYGRAKVSLVDGKLSLEWSSFKNPLEHFHFDTFTLKDNDFIGEEDIVFHLDGDGHVATMDYLGVTFRRAKQE